MTVANRAGVPADAGVLAMRPRPAHEYGGIPVPVQFIRDDRSNRVCGPENRLRSDVYLPPPNPSPTASSGGIP
jgi:hypothetical protein